MVVICRLFILIGIAGVYVSILLSNSLCLFYFVLWAAFLLFFFLMTFIIYSVVSILPGVPHNLIFLILSFTISLLSYISSCLTAS